MAYQDFQLALQGRSDQYPKHLELTGIMRSLDITYQPFYLVARQLTRGESG